MGQGIVLLWPCGFFDVSVFTVGMRLILLFVNCSENVYAGKKAYNFAWV